MRNPDYGHAPPVFVFFSVCPPAAPYAPPTGTSPATGNLTTPRSLHTATLLPDGRVLIAGGLRETPNSGLSLILASAELYDPSTGVVTATGNMITAQGCQGATLLTSG